MSTNQRVESRNAFHMYSHSYLADNDCPDILLEIN